MKSAKQKAGKLKECAGIVKIRLMKQYSEYIDSGVEWIRQIPEGWEIKKTKYIAQNFDGKRVPLSSEQRGNMEKRYPYWGSNGIIDYVEDYLFDGDYILVGEDGSPFFDRFKEVSFFINEKSWINNHIHVLKAKEVNPKFLVHSFNCVDFRDYISGSTRDKLNQSSLDVIAHPIPSLKEQSQIVTFLDQKTSIIDDLIQKKLQKIELLKEQRTSIINQAVTKGLNQDVRMKDTGVEWIGVTPANWIIQKLKYCADIIYGISPNESSYNDFGEGIELINGPVEYSEEDFGFTRSLKWTTDPKKFASKGSLLFCLRGSTTGRMNITHKDVAIGRGVCAINPRGSFGYTLHCMIMIRNYIQELISGSTFPSVTKDDVDNFQIPYPPLPEQHQIVEYLDKKTSEIDKQVDLENRKIDLLKEYRQSLISEVVTGKIDVRTN